VAWHEEGTQVSDYCTRQGHHLPILVERHRQAKCCQCKRLTFYRDDILMTHRLVRSTRSYEDQPSAALTEQNHWPYGPGDRAIELPSATFLRSEPGTGCSVRTGVTLIFAHRPNVSRHGCPCDVAESLRVGGRNSPEST
jgi:hypothetical protein